MPSQSVLVIGGGLAGLSSAVALADAGLQVRLIEKRPHLGGRATSYTLPDGSEVDNCQHVTLGCCTNLADFYNRVGAGDKIRFYSKLYFVDKAGRRSTIEAVPLPPPLHMLPSFLFFGALTLTDKRGIANAMLTIATAGGNPPDLEGVSMLAWLQRMKQTPAAIERFWRVVLVSALDEELAATDARYGIEVFWKAFLGSRGGYRVGIPLVPLADLYDGCRDSIVRKGGDVKMRGNVRAIRVDGGRFAGATLADGTEMAAEGCICAVPQNELLELLPEEYGMPGAPLAGVRQIRTSPITGVHLWYDRKVMTEPFLTLLDHTTQWVFNKSELSERSEKSQAQGGGQYLQLVISASYDLVPKSRQEI
ncbi:MAG TPA: hydroxysqualene dehydroxylase HpnE, partial [Candidatus Acidoferrales bacterium]